MDMFDNDEGEAGQKHSRLLPDGLPSAWYSYLNRTAVILQLIMFL